MNPFNRKSNIAKITEAFAPKKTKKDPQVDRMQKLAKIKEIINLS